MAMLDLVWITCYHLAITMNFYIKLKKEKAELIFGSNTRKIASARTFSENLLPGIDKLLKEAKLKAMPKFVVECSENASVISCNIARATASALNLDI